MKIIGELWHATKNVRLWCESGFPKLCCLGGLRSNLPVLQCSEKDVVASGCPKQCCLGGLRCDRLVSSSLVHRYGFDLRLAHCFCPDQSLSPPNVVLIGPHPQYGHD